jgi:pyruvate/2-oxoglutarate/acetoin dehydrogenase E1 component
VVHEDTITTGFAGEVLAVLASEAYGCLKAPPQRLCTADCPIPYNVEQMESIVPSVTQIRDEIEKLLRV